MSTTGHRAEGWSPFRLWPVSSSYSLHKASIAMQISAALVSGVDQNFEITNLELDAPHAHGRTPPGTGKTSELTRREGLTKTTPLSGAASEHLRPVW